MDLEGKNGPKRKKYREVTFLKEPILWRAESSS
jgi:hypothetical protein